MDSARLQKAQSGIDGTTMSDWQKIETAPKDGTKIIAWAGNDADDMSPQLIEWLEPPNVRESGWHISWDHRRIGNHGSYELPTHWMPVPQKPADVS